MSITTVMRTTAPRYGLRNNMKKQPEQQSYEAAFAELQQIVRELQEETVGIDALGAKIGRATELIRFCRERLRMTEDEIGKLTGE